MAESPKSEEPSTEVTIVGADFSIRDKIGVPLSALLSSGAISAAQRELDTGKNRMFERCEKDVVELRKKALSLKEASGEHGETLFDMRKLALRLKSTAGMTDYPMASVIADLLYKFLCKVTAVDETCKHIIITHTEAANAIFTHKITSSNDPTTMRVVIELEEMVDLYSNQ